MFFMWKRPNTEGLLTTVEAADILRVTRVRVHQLADCGILDCSRNSWNWRLFRREDVEALALKRSVLEELKAELRGGK